MKRRLNFIALMVLVNNILTPFSYINNGVNAFDIEESSVVENNEVEVNEEQEDFAEVEDWDLDVSDVEDWIVDEWDMDESELWLEKNKWDSTDLENEDIEWNNNYTWWDGGIIDDIYWTNLLDNNLLSWFIMSWDNVSWDSTSWDNMLWEDVELNSKEINKVLQNEEDDGIFEYRKETRVIIIAQKLWIDWVTEAKYYAQLAWVEDEYFWTKEQNEKIREFLLDHIDEILNWEFDEIIEEKKAEEQRLEESNKDIELWDNDQESSLQDIDWLWTWEVLTWWLIDIIKENVEENVEEIERLKNEELKQVWKNLNTEEISWQEMYKDVIVKVEDTNIVLEDKELDKMLNKK